METQTVSENQTAPNPVAVTGTVSVETQTVPQKRKVGRPREHLTRKVAFVSRDGKPFVQRAKGKPRVGDVVQWREVPV